MLSGLLLRGLRARSRRRRANWVWLQVMGWEVNGDRLRDGRSKDIAIVGASMVGANACCLAISALPSTASATRREIHPDWLQSSQALFHLGKLAISNYRQYSSHLARSVEPNTEFISSCWTMDISPDMVIFPVGFHADFLGNGMTRDWRFLCLI